MVETPSLTFKRAAPTTFSLSSILISPNFSQNLLNKLILAENSFVYPLFIRHRDRSESPGSGEISNQPSENQLGGGRHGLCSRSPVTVFRGESQIMKTAQYLVASLVATSLLCLTGCFSYKKTESTAPPTSTTVVQPVTPETSGSSSTTTTTTTDPNGVERQHSTTVTNPNY